MQWAQPLDETILTVLVSIGPPILRTSLCCSLLCMYLCVRVLCVCVCMYVKARGNVLVGYQSTAIPLLTIQVHHRGLNLPWSSLDLDKHQNPLLSSVLANQMPGSVTLSEDKPTYSQCGPLLSVCVSAKLKSSCFSCCLGASLPRWPWLIFSPTHTHKPVSTNIDVCIFSTQRNIAEANSIRHLKVFFLHFARALSFNQVPNSLSEHSDWK